MADDNQTPGQTPVDGVKPEEEMTEEELKALHEDEKFIEEFDPKDLQDEEKRAELEKRLGSAKTTLAQKRHYQGKVKEAGKAGKPAPAAPAAKPAETPAPAATEKKVDPQVATEFRLDHPELTKEQQKKSPHKKEHQPNPA